MDTTNATSPTLDSQDDLEEVETWEVSLEVVDPHLSTDPVRSRRLYDSLRQGGTEAAARQFFELTGTHVTPLASTAGPGDPAFALSLLLMGPQVEEGRVPLGRFRVRREAVAAYREVLGELRDKVPGLWSRLPRLGADPLEGLLALRCGYPLGHRIVYLSARLPRRFYHCADTCRRLRGTPEEMRHLAARRRGFIPCPFCAHDALHLHVDGASQALMRVPTEDLQHWALDACSKNPRCHSPTFEGINLTVQAELLLRAELAEPWWWGDSWIDRFLETGERPETGAPLAEAEEGPQDPRPRPPGDSRDDTARAASPTLAQRHRVVRVAVRRHP